MSIYSNQTDVLVRDKLIHEFLLIIVFPNRHEKTIIELKRIIAKWLRLLCKMFNNSGEICTLIGKKNLDLCRDYAYD